MRNEFTAIIEQDEGWFIAYSPELPRANGQGRTKDEAMQSLASAIELILEGPSGGGAPRSAGHRHPGNGQGRMIPIIGG
jgi:predicted RNase H-like HicB family nuclease